MAISRTGKAQGTDGFIRVRGAREHNLKNVDLEVPRDALVVFSGISGSGKSSLAFGTLYAEAQRRYLESVSPYARRLIDQVGVPDVDAIDGLPPAVALQQQRGTPNVRSTVGSVTTISSSLRMLYSRAGTYPSRQPMLYAEDFSPNTPQGACPHCHGLGHVYDVPEKLMVPNPSLSIRERAIASWPPAWHGQNLRDILVTLGYDVDKPWKDLSKKDRNWILYTEEQPSVPVYAGFTPAETRAALRRKTEPSYMGTFIGARKYVLQTFTTTQSAQMKKRVGRFLRGALCPACNGKRLKREALSVTFAGMDIGELSQLSLDNISRVLTPAARGQFQPSKRTRPRSKAATEQDVVLRVAQGGLAHTGGSDVRRTPDLSAEKQIAAQRIAEDVIERIAALQSLGLGYLSLDRITPTLSAGELQRLRLATQIRSQLFGVVYVLDEPSAGLHPADAAALHDALDDLKAVGNTLFVVEHDLDMLRRADWLVDVGPGAGSEGGRVLYSGPPVGLKAIKQSHTRDYLFPEKLPSRRQPRQPNDWLVLEGISRNNLRGLDVRFPIAAFTSVTGVSGSGKSSLVSQALVELVGERLGHPSAPDQNDSEPSLLEAAAPTQGHLRAGTEQIRRLVNVDQKPIGRTPRSNLATYTGLFDHVRKLFASTPAAKRRRFSAGRFSFNIEQGRCATCEGEGSVHVELLFMPSVYAPCPTCHGKRFNEKTLEVHWRGKDIAQVLALTVDEAINLFEDEAVIFRPLRLLHDIGLGYLSLGQPATQLSGGEAQRIKLVTELQRSQKGDTLYVLDEPTTGLHPADVSKLMAQLQGLVDAGNTVVVVEHEMRVVADSDWVIDIGPGAGDQGGRVVVEGTPDHVSKSKISATAPFLLAAMSQ
ncbi:excinuclease ABC subunit UvrA [Pseudoxanthomonas japonensis]|uniref:excinuclease ABC subunit UvrA n=1 Tax=Pseudoxanthomonas japonensis TaxID=69284 RepID=UPI001BCEE6DE|nr:excinuclease ABC subunit UvrA [Pseudoxanthomonas japonensis]